jgi:peptide/nickel transport system ATP-binding protein
MLLDIRNLSVHIPTREKLVKAVDCVDLQVDNNQTVALVGESGAGKTSLGLAILKLSPPNARLSGEILVEGRDVLQIESRELRSLRGRVISMVFQDVATGLNPVLTIGEQVAETLRNHQGLSKKEARAEAIGVLRRMSVRDADKVVDQYPFHLSGGMAQRVMIGIAMALGPKLLVADEPTSALDVTVQAQILEELRRLREQHGTSILLITHDLGVVAQMADRVAIMYEGHIVERGSAREIFKDPAHPYTEGLLATRPRLDADSDGPLRSIRPALPDAEYEDGLCPFLPRCHKALSQCRIDPAPPLERLESRHHVACYNPVVLNPEPVSAG